MSHALDSLEPGALWTRFAELARIPRPSKQEEKAVAWVRGIAAERGWPVDDDAAGNLVVRVPATAGRESAPTVVLQAHLDMVCEKNRDTEHDFDNDPILPRIDDDWVRATGTTLGADNGIGVAAALAVADDPAVAHGPLELLFTIDEETGLTGAQHLDAGLITGRTLLNMDSEDDGKIFVGCAGGRDCHLTLATPHVPAPAGSSGARLSVRGLSGGHSGLEIDANKGNAVKLLTRVLMAARRAGLDYGLASLTGGDKHNAIPRESDATLAATDATLSELERHVARFVEDARVELAGADDGVRIELERTDAPARVIEPAAAARLLQLLAVLPHGVLAMSRDLPGLVETSSNLAAVDQEDDESRILTSTRSSVGPSLGAVIQSIRAAGCLAGATVEAEDGYPGWKPDLDSAVLGVLREVYREIWNAEPEVTAVHAGLECGLLGERIPGIDMVSFGPEIVGAHSPDERVSIASVARFWRALVATLDRLSSS